MEDQNKDKLIKPTEEKEIKGITSTKTGGIKISGMSRLQAALKQAPKEDLEESFRKAAEVVNEAANTVDKLNDPLTATNRIAIMADISGSMSDYAEGTKRKIDLLKTALKSFLNQINFDTTSVAIYTFPLRSGYDWDDTDVDSGNSQGIKFKLSHNSPMLNLAVDGLQAAGGTPMHETMKKVINELPLTRGIIISDGEADRTDAALDEARKFALSETIIDTIHIGSSNSGEKLLQEIAKITGGLYLKFDNVTNFAKSFSYLTPENRAKLALAAGPQSTLAERNEVAKMLGAKEIK